MSTRVSLEQWRMFVAVVEQGGFLQAAEALNKTQSAVSHAVRKLESTLDQTLFLVEGRRAVLTELGHILLPKAKRLLGEAEKIESLARQYQPGVISELALAVDVVFPRELLYRVLERFEESATQTRVRLYETSLSGTRELLEDGKVELGIASTMPVNHVVEPLMSVPLVCVAAPGHPLFREGSDLERSQLGEYRQLVIRDCGTRSSQDTGWLGATQRWTVTNSDTLVHMLERGMGFGWVPEHCVAESLNRGRLRILPLAQGQRRLVSLQIGFPEHGGSDSATARMIKILSEECRSWEPNRH